MMKLYYYMRWGFKREEIIVFRVLDFVVGYIINIFRIEYVVQGGVFLY